MPFFALANTVPTCEKLFLEIFTAGLDFKAAPLYFLASIMNLETLQTALELICFLVIPAILAALTLTK